jgi:5-methylcytosine-specific restriction protein A
MPQITTVKANHIAPPTPKPLACAACGFDFERTYGERGRGYVECRHVIPLHETGERRVSISDLAQLCSNCHRMIPRKASVAYAR